MKPPQNDYFKFFRLEKDLYLNNTYSWKALMFQSSIHPQPHLRNQMEKCLPATPSSSFYSGKDASSLPRVVQRMPGSPSARSKRRLLTQAAKEKSQCLFPRATAERDPVKCHLRHQLNVVFQDTEILWPPLCFPLIHSMAAAVFICALSSINLCERSLAFAVFYFLLLTLLTILGGDKQLNNINNNILGTLINEFTLWPSCNHNCAFSTSLRVEEQYSQTQVLWILLMFQKTKEHKNLRNYHSSVDFIRAVMI